MARQYVNWQAEDAVAIITLNNPPMNVISPDLMQDLTDCLQEIKVDDSIRAVVIHGAGERAFCAGADIKWFPSLMRPGGAREGIDLIHRHLDNVDRFPKPVIAAVHGFALGGGMELSMACDLRVAAQSARFGQPEINLAIIPGGGGTQRLPRLVGPGLAKEICWLGDPIAASEAHRIGLVNRLAPDGEHLNAAKELAAQIASKARVAVKVINEAIDRGLNSTLETGLIFERDAWEEVFRSEDVAEGVAAFLEKRKPGLKHR